jgi:hypothetical protein
VVNSFARIWSAMVAVKMGLGSFGFIGVPFLSGFLSGADSKGLARFVPTPIWVRLGSFWLRFSEFLLILQDFLGSFCV